MRSKSIDSFWDSLPEVQTNHVWHFYFIHLYVRVGDIDYFEHLLLEGYDHIRDLVDPEDAPIIEVARSRGHTEMAEYLEGIREFEVGFVFKAVLRPVLSYDCDLRKREKFCIGLYD